MPLSDELAAGGKWGRATILLAAGASVRLGQPKQLLQVEGKSLLRRAAEAAVASGAAPVIVVLGSDAHRLTPELSGLPVFSVLNGAWQEGMGSSLRCGVEAVQLQAPSTSAVLFMVCDQPRITAAHLQALWNRYAASGRVIAVQHAGRPGVPAIFPAKYLPELGKIAGDQGARSLLSSLPDTDIELVGLPEAALDVDTPADLARLAAR